MTARRPNYVAQGASLKELMEQMRHFSPCAAFIYLHATRELDQQIAVGTGKLSTAAKKSKAKQTGAAKKRSRSARTSGRALRGLARG